MLYSSPGFIRLGGIRLAALHVCVEGNNARYTKFKTLSTIDDRPPPEGPNDKLAGLRHLVDYIVGMHASRVMICVDLYWLMV